MGGQNNLKDRKEKRKEKQSLSEELTPNFRSSPSIRVLKDLLVRDLFGISESFLVLDQQTIPHPHSILSALDCWCH